MRAVGLGVVIFTGKDSNFKVGDHVTGTWGIRACFVQRIWD